MFRVYLMIAVFGGTLALAGCGSDTSGPSAPPPPATLPADKLAPVPHGFKRVTNSHSGFSLAVPATWSVHPARGAVLIRSADRAFALSVAADRTVSSSLPLGSYAQQALKALPGYVTLRPQRAP